MGWGFIGSNLFCSVHIGITNWRLRLMVIPTLAYKSEGEGTTTTDEKKDSSTTGIHIPTTIIYYF